MLIKATLIGLLAIPMTANAALELDLSGLGKSPLNNKPTIAGKAKAQSLKKRSSPALFIQVAVIIQTQKQNVQPDEILKW